MNNLTISKGFDRLPVIPPEEGIGMFRSPPIKSNYFSVLPMVEASSRLPDRRPRKDVILEKAWVLFSRLEDTDDLEVVKAAVFFVNTYNFSVDELPAKLHDAVVREIQESAKQEYWSGVADLA